ncbi:hypothetical protein PPTG_21462 [Phytophthora nicotianae INRA-310]|uniref:Uncharacterized protein n=1 Tax=Phytophthora nicotianae (strain INRA-310) TaxID=761204 RepID=W2R437_PHYN3|nr:hypothetical protein PPTG_21462 [Phytophthora nicotianae INRA-310]ETN19459.1 hypothetical protein PPTG_21462 [Phytophthora nicotianae INRA-310]
MIKKGLQVPVPTVEAKLNCCHVIYMVAMNLYHDLKRRRDVAVAKAKHDGDSRKRGMCKDIPRNEIVRELRNLKPQSGIMCTIFAN